MFVTTRVESGLDNEVMINGPMRVQTTTVSATSDVRGMKAQEVKYEAKAVELAPPPAHGNNREHCMNSRLQKTFRNDCSNDRNAWEHFIM